MDGTYTIRWITDKPSDVSPAFSVTKQMTIAGNAMTFATLLEFPYRLQWEDSGTVFVAGDHVVEFTLWCEGDDNVHGTYIVDLPYYNPGQQVETWNITGYLTSPANGR